MSTNLERFKSEIKKLILLGTEMQLDLTSETLTDDEKKKYEKTTKEVKGSFQNNYQKWYSQVCAVVKQLLPDRHVEFVNLYHGDGRRKQIDAVTYNIQDWLNGIRAGEGIYGKSYNDLAIVSMRFNTQRDILDAAETRFESSLFDIAQLVRADIFDSELDSCRELISNGFLRGAGAIAGVVIEKHLAQVCGNHNIVLRKQRLTISDLNDALKNGGIFDVPRWGRFKGSATSETFAITTE